MSKPIPSGAVIFRFSGGGSEYRLTDKQPEVGDQITRDGDNWVVVSVEAEEDGPTVVTLRANPSPSSGV